MVKKPKRQRWQKDRIRRAINRAVVYSHQATTMGQRDRSFGNWPRDEKWFEKANWYSPKE